MCVQGKIWVSRSSFAGESSLLGHDTVSLSCSSWCFGWLQYSHSPSCLTLKKTAVLFQNSFLDHLTSQMNAHRYIKTSGTADKITPRNIPRQHETFLTFHICYVRNLVCHFKCCHMLILYKSVSILSIANEVCSWNSTQVFPLYTSHIYIYTVDNAYIYIYIYISSITQRSTQCTSVAGHSSQHNITQHGMLPQYPTGTAKLMWLFIVWF